MKTETDWQQYEREKRAIQARNLTPKEYEQECIRAAIRAERRTTTTNRGRK